MYLRTSPEVALSRIQGRKRDEEKELNIAQLINIHQRYESWIAGGASGYQVITIDANQDQTAVQKSLESLLKHRQILH